MARMCASITITAFRLSRTFKARLQSTALYNEIVAIVSRLQWDPKMKIGPVVKSNLSTKGVGHQTCELKQVITRIPAPREGVHILWDLAVEAGCLQVT